MTEVKQTRAVAFTTHENFSWKAQERGWWRALHELEIKQESPGYFSPTKLHHLSSQFPDNLKWKMEMKIWGMRKEIEGCKINIKKENYDLTKDWHKLRERKEKATSFTQQGTAGHKVSNLQTCNLS